MEHADGRSSNRRASLEPTSLPSKMAHPSVAPRMEEVCNPPRQGIYAGKVGSFEPIAWEAGECQIAGDCPAAMRGGSHMVDFKGKVIVLLG
jgi:hypothetical protein